jgi:hypothetical protein
MVRAAFAKNIATEGCIGVVSSLAHYELHSATPNFASVKVVLIVRVQAHLVPAFDS